jgi:hypothetical protein
MQSLCWPFNSLHSNCAYIEFFIRDAAFCLTGKFCQCIQHMQVLEKQFGCGAWYTSAASDEGVTKVSIRVHAGDRGSTPRARMHVYRFFSFFLLPSIQLRGLYFSFKFSWLFFLDGVCITFKAEFNHAAQLPSPWPNHAQSISGTGTYLMYGGLLWAFSWVWCTVCGSIPWIGATSVGCKKIGARPPHPNFPLLCLFFFLLP